MYLTIASSRNLKIQTFGNSRTLYNGNAYRLFSFWDTEEDTLVIATHGMIKKSQRTPLKEIEKAEAKRKEYFMNKG